MATKMAVLTADIVNSTRVNAATEKKIVKKLHQLLKSYKFEFYRGDSFQVLVKVPADALRISLLCRAAAIAASRNPEAIADVRISIGIGSVTSPVRSLATAKGEAFVLSGRAFDELTNEGTRLSISINDPLTNQAMEVISDYINNIFMTMTAKQAEVVVELLSERNQAEVALFLKKSKSTIHQHVTAGRWSEIEKLLQQYENLIKLAL